MRIASLKKMPRLFALLLALALLAACGSSAASETPAAPQTPAPADDSSYVFAPPADGTSMVNGGGMPIALAMAAEEAESGRGLAVRRGMQAFADTFHFALQVYTGAEPSQEASRLALEEASQGGASIVVCVGETMAVALHDAQADYPTVGYLLVDAEPHNGDYSDYTIAGNVHSVLFRAEQAAYLAGYAAVMDGYTRLGFLGGSAVPDTVRYCTGFIQGAEAAAVQQGIQATIKTWYSGFSQASEDITARMSGWYTDGTEIILAAGGDLEASCIAATQSAGTGRVIGVGWDHGAQGSAVLTSAANRYSAVVQAKLYAFFAAGGVWDERTAGQALRLGAQEEAVSLPTTDWRFSTFTADAYAALYDSLRTGALTVESYSDSSAFPPTANVTVEPQN